MNCKGIASTFTVLLVGLGHSWEYSTKSPTPPAQSWAPAPHAALQHGDIIDVSVQDLGEVKVFQSSSGSAEEYSV